MKKPIGNEFQSELSALNTILKALANLNDSQKQFVLRTVIDRLAISNVSPDLLTKANPAIDHGRPIGDVSKTSPKEFLLIKKPKTDIQKVACLAYYLTHNRKQKEFKTSDITALNTEAAQPKFSNATVAVDNATHGGQFLAPANGGKKQIAPHGEEIVMALPDYEIVKKIIQEYRGSKRHRKPRKTRKTN